MPGYRGASLDAGWHDENRAAEGRIDAHRGRTATLERWARRAASAQALAQRCRIVLACADGKDNKEVAAELGVHQVTVGKWRSRFIEGRLDGLADEDRWALFSRLLVLQG
jgi:hypothetical protein